MQYLGQILAYQTAGVLSPMSSTFFICFVRCISLISFLPPYCVFSLPFQFYFLFQQDQIFPPLPQERKGHEEEKQLIQLFFTAAIQIQIDHPIACKMLLVIWASTRDIATMRVNTSNNPCLEIDPKTFQETERGDILMGLLKPQMKMILSSTSRGRMGIRFTFKTPTILE